MAQVDVVHRQTDGGVPATDVRSARPLCPSVPAERTGRLPGREEQATAQGFAPAFADQAGNARATGLRVRARRHLQPVRGGRTQRRTADGQITDHRAKTDFVAFVQHLLEQVYATARRIHLVMDNLNTHFRKCFEDVLGVKAAKQLLRRVVFHYTPKHASWLNMAEIEIGILDRQCLESALARPCHPRRRSRCLAAAPKRRAATYRVDVHSARRGSENGSTLCFVINGT